MYCLIFLTRYCSIRLPAKYRAWRTKRKVLVAVCVTWFVPVLVFFPSILGWQYFVGRRTVPDRKCYVQYMEDALFNCLLQASNQPKVIGKHHSNLIDTRPKVLFRNGMEFTGS